MSEDNNKKIVIDASSGILGRIASYASKQALLGKEVIIVNCNNILLSGNRKMIINEYNAARKRGGLSLNGPHFPKHPERILKRTVRGMLNYQQGRGLSAFKRVICHNGVPEEYKNAKKILLEKKIKSKTMNLKELSSEI